MAIDKKLRVTLIRSAHGRLKNHKACVVGLGLRRVRGSAEVADSAANLGMINRISYLLKVEEL